MRIRIGESRSRARAGLSRGSFILRHRGEDGGELSVSEQSLVIDLAAHPRVDAYLTREAVWAREGWR